MEIDQVDKGKYWPKSAVPLAEEFVMRRGQVLDAAKVDGWHLKGVDASHWKTKEVEKEKEAVHGGG